MQEINRSRNSAYLLHVQIVFVTKYLNECALNFCVWLNGKYHHSHVYRRHYGDRHNIIVDTVKPVGSLRHGALFCIGLCVHVVAMRAPVGSTGAQRASFELFPNGMAQFFSILSELIH